MRPFLVVLVHLFFCDGVDWPRSGGHFLSHIDYGRRCYEKEETTLYA
jgi:hypothetical protein